MGEGSGSAVSYWRKDHERFHLFFPQVQRHLAPLIIAPTDYQDDADGSDIIIKNRAIALRGRGLYYFLTFPHDVTLRLWRESGARTDWAKYIVGGKNDWLFYYFADEASAEIVKCVTIDLHVLRELIAAGSVRYEDKDNGDGTSFRAIDTRSLDPRAFIYQWQREESGPTSDMLTRRALSSLTIDRRLADVCPACGLHSVSDLGERTKLARSDDGPTYQCCDSWSYVSPRLLLTMWSVSLHGELHGEVAH